MKTLYKNPKRTRDIGFTVCKTLKGLKVTTAWGNIAYYYPQDKNFSFFLARYYKGVLV